MSNTLPNELGSIEDLCKRVDKARQRKFLWESLMRDAFRYSVPNREIFYDTQTPGQTKTHQIFDDTAVLAANEFSNRLEAVLVPAWQDWAKLTPGAEVEEDAKSKIQPKLDEQTDVLFRHIHHSNFSVRVHEAFLDLSVTTLVLEIQRNENASKSRLNFRSIPIAHAILEEGPDGNIETVYQEKRVPARHIKRLWPDAVLNPKLQDLVKDKPDEDVKLVQGVIFIPETGMYELVVLSEGDKHVLLSQDMGESSPYVVARWMVTPGEIYGRGPGINVLSTIKTVNKAREMVLRHGALQISPPLMVKSGGDINPYTVRADPNTNIPVDSNDQRNPTIRPLEVGGNFDIGMIIIEDERDTIRKSYFNDTRRKDGPVQTATHEALEDRDMLLNLGANMGRVLTEFVERVVGRCVFVLQEAGDMARIKVDGKEVTLKHLSPLARAQDEQELFALAEAKQTSDALAGADITALRVKIEDIPEKVFTLKGIDADLIRSDVEADDMRQNVQQILAQRQEAAQEQ